MGNIYDKYGRLQGSAGYRLGELEPYIIEENGGVTYICYHNDASRAIRRITETTVGGKTTTVVEIAFGAWGDRASLDYIPVNEELEG